MKDNIVGRISHKDHDHPDTKYERQKCRNNMVAQAKAEQQAEPAPKVEVKRGRRSVAKKKVEQKSVTAVIPQSGMPLSVMREVIETLDYIEDQITGYAHVEGIALILDFDGTKYRATHDGSAWHVAGAK